MTLAAKMEEGFQKALIDSLITRVPFDATYFEVAPRSRATIVHLGMRGLIQTRAISLGSRPLATFFGAQVDHIFWMGEFYVAGMPEPWRCGHEHQNMRQFRRWDASAEFCCYGFLSYCFTPIGISLRDVLHEDLPSVYILEDQWAEQREIVFSQGLGRVLEAQYCGKALWDTDDDSSQNEIQGGAHASA